jgi:hypothetical protein
MLLGAGRNNPKPAASPCRYSAAACAVDHRWIDVVLGPVAIDRGPRGLGDHRPASALQRSPHEPVDKRILERREG